MNLQFLMHRSSKRTGSLAVSFQIAALLLVTLCVSGSSAWAQLASRTQLSVASAAQGADAKTVLTAKVIDVTGSPVSDGVVSFETSKGSLGSAFVQDGTATLAVSTLPKDGSAVTAVYQGGTVYGASRSATANVTSQATSTTADFSLTLNPSSATVTAGSYATISVVITPENGFSQAVNFSCSSLPAQAACTFTPASVTPTSTSAVTSALQLTTAAASGTSSQYRDPLSASHIAYAIALPGILALAGLGALRRGSFSSSRVMSILGIAALLAASCLGLGACSARYGYLNHPPAGNTGTAAGSYSVTIAAFSSNGSTVTSHITTLALTVK